MSSLEDYFSEEVLLKTLCSARLAISRRLHDEQFFQRLAPMKRSGAVSEDILELFPPRSRWSRTPKSQRGRDGSTFAERKKALFVTVKKLRQKNDPRDQMWILRQNQLISSIRRRILTDSKVQLSRPKMLLSRKASSSSEYRALASYGLEDKILMGQAASYLRETFDSVFLKCSFAFRPRRDKGPAPTHHDAFGEIISFWDQFHNSKKLESIWVAECDIKGFFDTVSHSIVIREFDHRVEELALKNICVDSRARVLILAYLKSYTYGQYARGEALKIFRSTNTTGEVKDRGEDLQVFYQRPEVIAYGIPQGGAISCFIANLLLHKADESVMKHSGIGRGDLLYVRYCDDMVLLGENSVAVARALEDYKNALKDLRLPIHEFGKDTYGLEFWHAKSKGPYSWGPERGSIPWMSFVGYQLRHDGQIRVRPSSMQKELDKQTRLVRSFLWRVMPAISRGVRLRRKESLINSLRSRLQAMSVGRRPNYVYQWGDPKECWCAGFGCLVDKRLPQDQWIARKQLRHLDRGRGVGLRLAQKRVTRFPAQGSKLIQPAKRRPEPFPGKPHSYAAFLESGNGKSGKTGAVLSGAA